MRRSLASLSIAEWAIVFGCVTFIAVLCISAAWERDIRWLHFFQTWMYIAALVLSLRRNRWGYFLGIAIAAFWDYANVFVTTFLQAGLEQVSVLTKTGHLPHPDYFIAVPAWIANLVLLLGCAWAYARFARKEPLDTLRLLVAFAASMAFLAADMALFQPRYLAIFGRMLHPHLHL